jgi:hypothetical protein
LRKIIGTISMLDFSNTDIYVSTAPVAAGWALFFRLFVPSPRFLAPSGAWGWFDSACRDGRGGLARNVRKDVGDRLRGQGGRYGWGYRQRRDLDHGPIPGETIRNPLFTMCGIFLHARNEGSVKHTMIKILSDALKAGMSGHFKGLGIVRVTL